MLPKPVIVPVAMTGVLPVGVVMLDAPPPQATMTAAAAAAKMVGIVLFMMLTSSEWPCCFPGGSLEPRFRLRAVIQQSFRRGRLLGLAGFPILRHKSQKRPDVAVWQH